jgi:hypothetical protein
VQVAIKIADDVSPLARRSERHGARALANGKAFYGLERNTGLGGKTLVERFEQAKTHWARL